MSTAVVLFVLGAVAQSGALEVDGSPGDYYSTSLKTCAELMEEGNPNNFAYRGGSTEVCSSSKVFEDGAYQCHRNSISFQEAVGVCEAIGARLCTVAEIRQNWALDPASPCSVDSPGSFCWTHHDGVDAAEDCELGSNHVVPCKQAFGQPTIQPICVADDFAGSLKCCADGSIEDTHDRGIDHGGRCAQHKCGRTCAEESGCGWSTPRMKCVACEHAQGCTNKKELKMGECEADLDAIDRKSRCAEHTCGRTCANDRLCGWSTPRMKCVPGGNTNKHELHMGVCEGGETGEELDCSEFICGATCADHPGCGWSTPKMACVAGGTTRDKELTMGVCTDADFSAHTGLDVCSQHICGADCAAQAGCGWSSTRMKCVAGVKTSLGELSMGHCTEGAHCSSFNCAAECAKHPGCGWSSNKKVCKIGGSTSQHEIGECNTRAPTFALTSAPTKAPKESTPAPVEETDAPKPVCVDMPADWVDKDGDGCQTYVDKQWCNPDGSYGPKWAPTDTYKTYENNGHTADVVCCGCGGGYVETHAPTSAPTKMPTTLSPTSAAPSDAPTSPPTTAGPTSSPTSAPTMAPTEKCFDYWADKDWTDISGDTCEDYELNMWCNTDGTPGSGWGAGQQFSFYASGGIDALQACCACGGGSKEQLFAPTHAPTEAPKLFVEITGELCSVSENPRSDKPVWGSGHSFNKCQNRCKSDATCKFFTYLPFAGWCQLLKSCDVRTGISSPGDVSYYRNE